MNTTIYFFCSASAPLHFRPDPPGHRAANVVQRETVDHRIELIQAVNLGKAPRSVDFAGVEQ